jgi:Family of unknown function (DUF5691)
MKHLSQLVRFIVTGTERADRSVLPDVAGTKMQNDTSGQTSKVDAPKQLLEALATAVLLDKAGFGIEKTDGFKHTQPPNYQTNKPSYPSDDALRSLERILRNYPDCLLSEWLIATEAKGYALPPEYLPDLLDRAMRDAALRNILGQVRDPKLRWLAAQNPTWGKLFPDLEQADWFTSDFGTRLALLKEAREHRPLVALSWLEKTWMEENNEHKIAFLTVFQSRLSAFDEPLLQKAQQSKSREMRTLSASLLAQISESQFFSALSMLRQRLTPFVVAADFTAFLSQTIPDVGDVAFKTLANLIHAKETDTLRTGILLNYLNFAPPSWLSETLNISLDVILDQIQNDPDKQFTLSGIIHATTLHRDMIWARAILTFLSKQPAHPLWKSARLEQLIANLSDTEWDEVLSDLCRQHILLDHFDSVLFKVLSTTDRAWPKNILRALLSTWYDRAQSRFTYNTHIWSSLLRNAAIYCRPSDALEMSSWLNHQPSLPHPAAKDLDAFWDVVKLRQKMVDG